MQVPESGGTTTYLFRSNFWLWSLILNLRDVDPGGLPMKMTVNPRNMFGGGLGLGGAQGLGGGGVAASAGSSGVGAAPAAAAVAAAAAADASYYYNGNLLTQLSSLLESAQALLAEYAPNSQYHHQQHHYQYQQQQQHPTSNYYGVAGSGGCGPQHHVSMYGKDYDKFGNRISQSAPVYSLSLMQSEVRTLEFWRSIVAECLSTFLYVLIVCSVTTVSSEQSVQTNSALGAGLTMAALTAAFAKVSGAHSNPAVTMAMVVARHVSPLRAMLYIGAQCGGGVAGAALVQGVYKRTSDPALKPGGGAFGMEFVLTFVVAYVICSSRADYTPQNPDQGQTSQQPPPPSSSSWPPRGVTSYNPPAGVPAPHTFGTSSSMYASTYSSYMNSFNYNSTYYANSGLSAPLVTKYRANPTLVGAAYASCLFAWTATLNPARALGSAFVSENANRFQQHWVFWLGPILGAMTGAFSYEFIFTPRVAARANYSLMSVSNSSTTAATTGTTNLSGAMGSVGTSAGIINSGVAASGLGPTSMGTSGNTTNNMAASTYSYGGGAGGARGGVGAAGVVSDSTMIDMSMQMNPDETMTMIDDMDRAKQYSKVTNNLNNSSGIAMQDFGTYSSSSMLRHQQPYMSHKMGGSGGRYLVPSSGTYADSYGGTLGTKYMYGNAGLNQQHHQMLANNGFFYDSYDGSGLRRSKSSMFAHTKLPPRRNPYDYLPEEPQSLLPLPMPPTAVAGVPSSQQASATAGALGTGTSAAVANGGLSNKPDIMQSVDMSSSSVLNDTRANRSMLGKSSLSSPSQRYGGATSYATDSGGLLDPTYGVDKLDGGGRAGGLGYDQYPYHHSRGLKVGGGALPGQGIAGSGMGAAEEMMYLDDPSSARYAKRRVGGPGMPPIQGGSGYDQSNDAYGSSGYASRSQQAQQRMAHLRSRPPAANSDGYYQGGGGGVHAQSAASTSVTSAATAGMSSLATGAGPGGTLPERGPGAAAVPAAVGATADRYNAAYSQQNGDAPYRGGAT